MPTEKRRIIRAPHPRVEADLSADLSITPTFAEQLIAWQKIAGQYSEKMRARNIPLILRQRDLAPSRAPERMALGFAGFLVFIRSSAQGGGYLGHSRGRAWPVEDERTAWFARVWQDSGTSEAVDRSLSEEALWGADLRAWPAFAGRVRHYVNQLLEKDAGGGVASAEARPGAG